MTPTVTCIKQVNEISIFMEFHWPPLPLLLFEQTRQEIGMLIMNYKDDNWNDLSGFTVLSQIGLIEIMDMMMGVWSGGRC